MTPGISEINDVEEDLSLRPGGMMRGRIWISQDFDAIDPEIETLFYGEEPTKT